MSWSLSRSTGSHPLGRTASYPVFMCLAYSSPSRPVAANAATGNGRRPSAIRNAPGLSGLVTARGARSLKRRSMRSTHRSAGSIMWESADTTRSAIIFPPGLSILLVCARDSTPARRPGLRRRLRHDFPFPFGAAGAQPNLYSSGLGNSIVRSRWIDLTACNWVFC